MSLRTSALTFAFTLGLVSPAIAGQDEHPGAAPYQQVCQMCHGELGKGDMAPPLVLGELDPEYVLAIVREGYGQMPPISRRELTDDQIRQVVAYLASLRDAPAAAARRPGRPLER